MAHEILVKLVQIDNKINQLSREKEIIERLQRLDKKIDELLANRQSEVQQAANQLKGEIDSVQSVINDSKPTVTVIER